MVFSICVCEDAQHDKLKVVFQIEERRFVANFATGRPRKKILYLFLYIIACMLVEVILTKEQNIIITFRIKKCYDL